MIDEETIASLSMKTTQALDTIAVGAGILYNKAEIDGDSLITANGTTRRFGSASGFMQLGFGTDRASVK
jgi:hypothetical protein